MPNTKSAIEEYKRLMSRVDMTDKARGRIIKICMESAPSELRVVPKPAIAAISGAAVIAAAVGIKKIYNIRNRP